MRTAAGIPVEGERSSARVPDGARFWFLRGIEEHGEDVVGEWRTTRPCLRKGSVGAGELALDARTLGKERKTKVSKVAKRVERKKKSNGEPACPRIRGNQQIEEGKQRALSKEKAAATRLEIPVDGERSSARVPTVLASRSRARM